LKQPPGEAPPLRERFLEWILGRLGGGVPPGWVPRVFGWIRLLFSGQPRRYFLFHRRCSRRGEWIYPFFAAHEIGSIYPAVGAEALDLLESLSGRDHDLVREAAARSWSDVLEADFEAGFQRVRALSRRDDYPSRHTAALAPVLFYGRAADDGQKRRLMDFWERYREDPRSGLRNLVRTQIRERLVEP